MQAKLIHPLDLSAKLPSFTSIRLGRGDGHPVDDLIEIDGKLYYQTVRVPAVTKEIR